MRRLRVGFLASGWSPEPGGVQTVTLDLAEELMCRGHLVSALVLDSEVGAGDGQEREALVSGVHVRRVGWSYSADGRLEDLARTGGLEAHVLRWARDRELDLVHIHHLSGWGLGVPARLAELGFPVLWTLHDYWALCPRGQMFHVEGRGCTRAEAETCGDCMARTWPHLAAPSPESAAALRLEAAESALAACGKLQAPSAAAARVWEAHGLAPGRIEVRPNATRRPEPARPRERGEALRVGVLGAVQPSKGVLELARWMEGLEGLELHVHGPMPCYHGDPSYGEELRRLAERSERLTLHGAFAPSELWQVLASLDLVAVPSLWEEVFGLAAREARAAGLPVFASAVGGLREADAQLLPAGDGDAWRDALVRFAADPAWRAELSAPEAGLHGIEAVVDRLESDYQALLG